MANVLTIRRMAVLAIGVVTLLFVFDQPGSPAAAPPGEKTFFDQLPASAQQHVLWFADHEEASMADWDEPDFRHPGGGIFNTGSADQAVARASGRVAHTGRYSASTSIEGAYRAQGSRAVRLMRWLDTAWDNGGDYFPNGAYYSTWIFFPEDYNPNKYDPWDPGDGGWWNIFQFKADIEDTSATSVPMFTLNVDHDDATGQNTLYVYSKENPPHSYGQSVPIELPRGKWVHLEAHYVADVADGSIRVWQDGQQIFRIENAKTIMTTQYPNITWGIGNYTDHVAGGPVDGAATIFFDDAAVSTTRLSQYVDWSPCLPPTPCAASSSLSDAD